MKTRSAAPAGYPVPPVSHELPRPGTQAAAHPAGADASRGPVIVLSCAYAGASQVQSALAAGSELACTAGTGIIPLCAAAADTWRSVENMPGTAMSPLATATIRGLVTAQLTAILANSGKTRWCELATASPGAAEVFLQVFPHARFICVHRRCLEVVADAVRANPWGLQGQGLAPYLLIYPGNSVAALAAYWANSAEQLIEFEHANREVTHRVRYEDVVAHPDQALATVRATLGLAGAAHPVPPGWLAEPGLPPADPQAEAPAELIPHPLRERISRLHAELGYHPTET